MTHITLMVGLPGSGKTTHARELVEQDPSIIRLNRDDLRMTFFNELSGLTGDQEWTVTEAQVALAEHFGKRGRPILVDDTNLSKLAVQKWRDLAKKHGWGMTCISMQTPLEECIERNAKRENPVPENVIRGMAKRKPVPPELYHVEPAEPYVPKPGTPQAIIVDIDGTLAHNVTGRPWYGDHGRYGEDEYDHLVGGFVHDWLNDMEDRHVLFVSGRSEHARTETEEWLWREGGFWFGKANREESHLFMRPDDDHRQDHIIKREIFDEHIRDFYDVKLALEDRKQVCDMWASLGLKVWRVNQDDTY